MNGWEVGISKPAAVAGAIGALLSLQYLEQLTRWQRATAVATGFFFCVYVTPIGIGVLHSWLGWSWLTSPHTESGLSFLLGLCGMSAAGTLLKIIKVDIRSWLRRWTGGPSDNT